MMADFTAMFEHQEAAEARLAAAEHEYPLAYALVMAALSWERVDRRRWHTLAWLCAQTRRLIAAWSIPAGSVEDPDTVGLALDWAVRAPALLERDDQGRLRPVFGAMLSIGPSSAIPAVKRCSSKARQPPEVPYLFFCSYDLLFDQIPIKSYFGESPMPKS